MPNLDKQRKQVAETEAVLDELRTEVLRMHGRLCAEGPGPTLISEFERMIIVACLGHYVLRRLIDETKREQRALQGPCLN